MDENVIKRVRKLSQQYAYTAIQMHETVARKAGLPETDHKYLGFLLEKGRMTAGDLAQLTGLTTGAVTGLVDRFEKRGLVNRRFAGDDRRKVLIEPNQETIVALLEPLYREFRSQSEALTTSFLDEEIKVIETYLSKAIDLMRQITHTLNEN